MGKIISGVFSATLLSVLTITSVISVASAHLANGEDVTQGEYIVDFGFDPAAPQALGKTTLAFNLVHEDDKESVAFTDAWVRISKGDAVVFSGMLYPEILGNATMLMTFPASGTYDVQVQFKDSDGKVIAGSTFTLPIIDVSLPVSEGSLGNYLPLIVSIIIALTIGIIVGMHGRTITKI